MSGLRAQNKADKTLRIREAAWSLFVEQGYEAATVRGIAKRPAASTPISAKIVTACLSWASASGRRPEALKRSARLLRRAAS